MSLRKTGAIAGIALLLGGIVSANAATVGPNVGVSPRATDTYATESMQSNPNGVDYGQTGSIRATSTTRTGDQADPYAHCLGASPRLADAYSCHQ